MILTYLRDLLSQQLMEIVHHRSYGLQATCVVN
jgi:hypothetical protein